MDRFKVKSDLLKGEKAKNTLKLIGYELAKTFDMEVIEDVLGAIITGLDGGPERYADAAQDAIIYINNNINNIKNIINKKKLHIAIETFIMESHGWISYNEIDRELSITSPLDKSFRRKIIFRLVEEGKVEKHKDKSGVLRKVENQLEQIPWWNADLGGYLNLFWPFGIEKYVRIYPKSIVVVAGTKDSGKTALVLDFIKKNMNKFPIKYFSSEMGPQKLRERLSLFEDISTEEWKKVEWYPRVRSFSQVISPDVINIIDFYEITDNFFSIGSEFIDIFEKLDKGIAVIALQKKPGQKLGRGAEFSLEKADLYLSIEKGKLEIISGKTWVDHQINPAGIKFNFKLWQGHKFILKNIEGATKEETVSNDEIPF